MFLGSTYTSPVSIMFPNEWSNLLELRF